MSTKAPHKTAILNRFKILQYIHRFGWLRTKDLACLVWLPSRRGDPSQPPDFLPAWATGSALRMAQRTIRSLLESGLLLQTKAPARLIFDAEGTHMINFFCGKAGFVLLTKLCYPHLK